MPRHHKDTWELKNSHTHATGTRKHPHKGNQTKEYTYIQSNNNKKQVGDIHWNIKRKCIKENVKKNPSNINKTEKWHLLKTTHWQKEASKKWKGDWKKGRKKKTHTLQTEILAHKRLARGERKCPTESMSHGCGEC